MANRLTQISTRTGDDGSTGLGDGTRTRKDALRVHAMGDVDELNSGLGVLLAEPLPDDVRELLGVIQHELFNLGGELSIPGFELLKAEAVARLDEALVVETTILAVGGATADGLQTVRRAEDGAELARIAVKLACIRLAGGKPTRIPEPVRAALSRHIVVTKA